MTKTIIYHNSEKLAKGVRRPRSGETLAYRSIEDWDEKENDKADEVVDLSTPKSKPKRNQGHEKTHNKLA